MLDDEIGPAFLGALSLVFGGYGVRELALACRLGPSSAWIERALPGAGALVLGAPFAWCGYRLVDGV